MAEDIANLAIECNVKMRGDTSGKSPKMRKGEAFLIPAGRRLIDFVIALNDIFIR